METETERDTAEAEVTRLTGELSTANASATSLTAQLETANGSVTSLTADLATAKAEVTRLTNQIGSVTDPTSLQGLLAAANANVTRLTADLLTANTQVTTLTGQLTIARAEVASLRRRLVDAQADVTEERERADQAEIDAQAEINRQVQAQSQDLEANQRAQNLKKAFPGGGVAEDGTFPSISATVSPVTLAVPSSGRLTLTRGGHVAATLSGSGTRMTTMALTRGADSGKTVVYTDRELSRSLLEHFGDQRDASDMTRFNLTGPLAPGTDKEIPHFSTTPPVTTTWRISHGIRPAVSQVDDPDFVDNPADDNDVPGKVFPPNAVADNTRMGSSFTGYLFGLSGHFVCAGGTNCQVQVVPDYADTADSNGRYALESVSVGVTATGGGMLYFRPGSSPLRLYEGGPVGADVQYMVFGYWREDPTSAAADYEVGVFAQAFDHEDTAVSTDMSTDAPASFTATYDGTAVGMYVEQDPTNPVDTHRQGEFTADVDLSISGTLSTLTGTIDDFVTMPTDGSAAPRTSDRWVVDLAAGGDARIRTLTGVKAGNWVSDFVPAHQYAADDEPPAVTGTFNTRVADFVHLLGAFGAEKR